ncbi:MAG TPA: ChbG/HpnK family deacetylase [Hyphomicrobiaceae bacterium]|nr:ChbG/HpnK family deacetylase [Hyphomicrobiaceae bacterium]
MGKWLVGEDVGTAMHERIGAAMVRNGGSETGAPTPKSGALILNADDFGRDRPTTDRIAECCATGAVSSVSAMVFMEDSERAAELAREQSIEVGLHLNFTAPFSGKSVPVPLAEHQERIARHLRRHRLAQVVPHPGLIRSFQYVTKAQLDEFHRLYGFPAERIDGHHHMHLCANVLLQKLLPRGTMVRRNFSFDRGEKSLGNTLYRNLVDRALARRHWLTDYFFSLPPLEPVSRLEKIYTLARQFTVEVETHPVNPDEYRYLAGGAFFRQIGDVRLARPSVVRARLERGLD